MVNSDKLTCYDLTQHNQVVWSYILNALTRGQAFHLPQGPPTP